MTWWAGEPSHLSHIITNLSSLVVKPASRGDGTNGGNAVFGWEITADEREELARRTREAVLAMTGDAVAPLDTVFENAYAEPHPLVAEELAWHRQWQAGFADTEAEGDRS